MPMTMSDVITVHLWILSGLSDAHGTETVRREPLVRTNQRDVLFQKPVERSHVRASTRLLANERPRMHLI